MLAGLALAAFALTSLAATAQDTVLIGPTEYVPVLAQAAGQERTRVAAFRLDRVPVTNARFLGFVRSHPEWRRDRVPRLLADQDYLSHWSQPDDLGASARPDQLVTRVSWFAARAFCASEGRRLPDWSEWELAAAADDSHADARNDPAWRERMLAWYSQPATRPLEPVGQSTPNVYGVQDLNGLIWEWVEDFGALMMSADSREQGDPDRLRFCGAGALSAADRENYPMLMRIAFLSSLSGSATSRDLGFRCAAAATP